MKHSFYLLLLVCSVAFGQNQFTSIKITNSPTTMDDSSKVEVLVREKGGTNAGMVRKVTWEYLASLFSGSTTDLQTAIDNGDVSTSGPTFRGAPIYFQNSEVSTYGLIEQNNDYFDINSNKPIRLNSTGFNPGIVLPETGGSAIPFKHGSYTNTLPNATGTLALASDIDNLDLKDVAENGSIADDLTTPVVFETTSNIALASDSGLYLFAHDILAYSAYAGFQGIKYNADLSANFTGRSLPDIDWVNNAIEEAIDDIPANDLNSVLTAGNTSNTSIVLGNLSPRRTTYGVGGINFENIGGNSTSFSTLSGGGSQSINLPKASGTLPLTVSINGGTPATANDVGNIDLTVSSGGTANLTGTPSGTNYVITNSAGTGVTINGADGANAGLLLPGDKNKLNLLSGTNTGDNVQATETVSGIAEIATQAETNLGSDDQRIVTPAKMFQFVTTLLSTYVTTNSTQTISAVKTFSAAPTVPDQTAGNNSGNAANTKYVDTGLALKGNLVGGNSWAGTQAFTGTVTVGNGLNLGNATSTRFNINMGSATGPGTVSRNLSDTVSAFAITNSHTSSTGNIVDFNSNIGGTTAARASVTKAGNLYFPATANGIVLTSPDGTKYLVTVANGGALQTTVITTP